MQTLKQETMSRFILASIALATLAGCATSKGPSRATNILEFAQAEAAVKAQAREYSRFSIARYASLTDDPETAASGYAYIVRRAPEDESIAERAMFSSLLIGDVDLAKRQARKLPRETLQSTELPRIVLGVDDIQSDARSIDFELMQSPWRQAFHRMLAQNLMAWSLVSKNPEQAIALQESAGDGDGILIGVAQTLGAIMKASLGQNAEARADLETLRRQGIQLAIGVALEGRLLALDGRYDDAERILTAFDSSVGRNPAITTLLSDVQNKDVKPASKLNARTGAALSLYATTAALAAEAETDLPAAYFALAVHLDPDLDAAKTLWANALDKADRRAEAIDILSSIEPSSIHHTSAQGQLAWALRREEQNEEALRLARDTLARTDDRNIQIQLADLLMSLNEDGQAETVLSDVIAGDETVGRYDWRIYFARGAARERLGRWPPAEDDLRTALGLQPSEPVVLNHLGYGLIVRGLNLDEGLSLIERALLLSPQSGAITDSLGWAHYKLGNYDRAVFYLERATELSPQSVEILDHLGDAYWQVGRYTEAGYQWQRALKYVQSGEQRDQIFLKLENGLQLAASGAQ